MRTKTLTWQWNYLTQERRLTRLNFSCGSEATNQTDEQTAIARAIVEYDVPPNEGGRLTVQRRDQAPNRATPHPFLKLVGPSSARNPAAKGDGQR
jgi:hypothetical protein